VLYGKSNWSISSWLLMHLVQIVRATEMNGRTTTYEVSRVNVLLNTAYMCTTIACASA
jgi:hypothetical protein